MGQGWGKDYGWDRAGGSGLVKDDELTEALQTAPQLGKDTVLPRGGAA